MELASAQQDQAFVEILRNSVARSNRFQGKLRIALIILENEKFEEMTRCRMADLVPQTISVKRSKLCILPIVLQNILQYIGLLKKN